MKSLGSVFMAYKNKKATRFVIENFRKHFKDSKTFLVSDGGDDFSEFENEFDGLKFIKLENILGNEVNNYRKLPYEAFRMKEYWRRVKCAVDFCTSEYMIILEDDVFVTSRFDFKRDLHLAGWKGPPLSHAMRLDISRLQNGMNVERYGMCGGSVFNSKTFLDIYDDVIKDIEDNHDKLLNNPEYYLLGASDANLVYHFSKRGYVYENAEWLSHLGQTYNALSFPVVHDYKELYDRKTSNGAFI